MEGMPWYERLAQRLRASGRFWDIQDHDDESANRSESRDYLSRYYLVPGRRGHDGRRCHEDRLWSFANIVLHQFHRSDGDGYHTHPWHFWISIVLAVGYWEITPSGRRWRRPGTIAFRSGLSCHRVELDPTKPKPWTIFIMGPKWITWGFFLSGVRRWVPYWLHLYHPHLRPTWFARRIAHHLRSTP